MEINLNQALMLDGNAAAGLLQQCFSSDVTAEIVRCGSCEREGPIGDAHAYSQAPGLVLRCKNCSAILLRIVETPEAHYLDAQGLAFIRLSKSAS
jgi:hypothetical protein